MTLHTDFIEHRNISLLVRPARVAILIPQNEFFWKHIMLEVFEWCSKVWGGAYFIVVPTDGKEIKPAFWKILEEYSPDHIAAFIPTLQDLARAEPKTYNDIIARYKKSFFEQSPGSTEDDFQNLVGQQLNSSNRYQFEIEAALQQEIKQRLAPFYHGDFIVQARVSAQGYVNFPLTQLNNIVKQSGLEKVFVVDELADIDCSLVFYSNWGLYKPDFAKILTANGVKINHVPNEARLVDLLQFSVEKHVDNSEIKLRKRFRKEIGGNDDFWYPDEDIFQHSPFEVSLIKVGKYKILDENYYEEPTTLIIGDSIEDFCLYYCLSKIQDAVYWMPEVKLRMKDAEPSARYALSSSVAQAIMRKINYGHSNNSIVISSLSLSLEELEVARKQLAKLVYMDESFGQGVTIQSSPWLIRKSTLRLIEQNNYTTSYTEAFRNNKGVGKIPTPKPKNFGEITPYDHRWITEFTIEGYVPPPLHFLGKKIVELRGLTDETRVAKTGLCYSCPNIAYFGGDIDVTLVRPRVNLVEPLNIFQEYFGEAEYKDVRFSDKGVYTQQTIDKFGSLDEVGSFLQLRGNRDLLTLFLNQKSLNVPNEGEVVYVNSRAYANFQAIQTHTGTIEQTTDLIDSLIQKGILYRGTILQCSLCREADWYGLGDLDQLFICHRCNQRQTIQQRNWKEGNEPSWFYKLDEIVYQGIKNNMVLPLLTLMYLKQKSRSSFLFVPELELRHDPKSSKPEREIDICCIIDGRIVLGECRIDDISKALIDKLNLLSSALLKSPDQLIFATMSSKISEQVSSHAQSMIRVPFTFVTQKDLVSPEL